MMGNNLKLSTKISLLSFSLVLLVGLLGGYVMVNKAAAIMEDEMGKRVLAVARTLAQVPVIQESIEKDGGWELIQPIAEKTRVATGVEYIVVVNMRGIRYSHPVAERIGKPFSGEDLAAALSDREVITPAAGVLGPSVRALVPVKADQGNRQVGVVVVGILIPTYADIVHNIRFEIYLILFICLTTGLLGSVFLAHRIKKAMFRMEPEEIARLLEERTAILQAMGEGIIAIDRNCIITVANDAAEKIINIGSKHVGRSIREVLKESHLPRVLETGEPEYNQERHINNTVIISTRVPIRVGGQVVGAVASFRDRTEIHRMAEELTGVKAFVEALRVQNHEHLNRLHAIAGLIQLKQYQNALDYVFHITEEQQNITIFLNKRIKDPSVAGLLLGKYGRAREIGAELVIDKETGLNSLPGKTDSNTMVVILGNLLENALEAVQRCRGGERNIYLSIKDQNNILKIIVRDTGHGIPLNIRKRVFELGFSTKKDEGHGLGLYLVKSHVEAAGGTITVECPEGGGTRVEITIPYSVE